MVKGYTIYKPAWLNIISKPEYREFSNQILRHIQEDYTIKIKNKVIVENMKYVLRNDKDPELINIMYNQLKEHPLEEQWFKEHEDPLDSPSTPDTGDPLMFFKIDYYTHHIKRILAQYDKMNKLNTKLKLHI